MTVKECVSFKTPTAGPLISRPTPVKNATLDTSSKMEYASWKKLKVSAIPIAIPSQTESAQNVLPDTISTPQRFVSKLTIHVNRSVWPTRDVWNVIRVTNSAHLDNASWPSSQLPMSIALNGRDQFAKNAVSELHSMPMVFVLSLTPSAKNMMQRQKNVKPVTQDMN